MIKVLYIRSSFDPGGIETLLLNLFNYPQKKNQFHYVLIKNGKLINKLKSNNNKFYTLFRKKTIDFIVLYNIIKILKRNNIQIIHTHQLLELVYGVIIKFTNPKIKLYHTIHGYHDKQSKWSENLEKILIYFTSKTFTVSHATKSILLAKGYTKHKLNVLYNAVTIPEVSNQQSIEQFKKLIDYKNENIIIGMIGNFVWWKDQLTIIKAFNLIKNSKKNLKLIFIGKESELELACKTFVEKNELNKRVYFLGSLENAGQYLHLFKIFIMSTLYDTFGIVVIEALLNGIPTIASNIKVMEELSHKGKYFDLFEVQNPNSLAKLLVKNIDNENLTRKKCALKYAKNLYSYEKYITNLYNIYLT